MANSSQDLCASLHKKSVSQVLLERRETEVPEEDKDCKVTRVKRDCKVSWDLLEGMGSKGLWEIKESKEIKAKKVVKVFG